MVERRKGRDVEAQALDAVADWSGRQGGASPVSPGKTGRGCTSLAWAAHELRTGIPGPPTQLCPWMTTVPTSWGC